MVICPKCKREVNEDASYCPYCGARLKVNIEAIKLKVEEYRHEELTSWGILGIGAVLLIIGFILVSIKATRYEWKDWTLYQVIYSPYASAAMVIITVGLLIFALGAIIGAYYSYKRSKLMKEIEGNY